MAHFDDIYEIAVDNQYRAFFDELDENKAEAECDGWISEEAIRERFGIATMNGANFKEPRGRKRCYGRR
jgi:hypothetical protein